MPIAGLRAGRFERIETSIAVDDAADALRVPVGIGWYKCRAVPDIYAPRRPDGNDPAVQRLFAAICALGTATWFSEPQAFNDLVNRAEPHWQQLRAVIRGCCPEWKRQQFKREADQQATGDRAARVAQERRYRAAVGGA